MAQTKTGALKTAAIKAGMTYDDYLEKLASGERRCTRCKTWRPIVGFGNDRTRYDGLDRVCHECRRVKVRKVTKGRVSPFKGRRHTDKAKAKIGDIHKGNSHRLGKRLNIDTRLKISATLRVKAARGIHAPGYVDGKGAERFGIRHTKELKRWRYDVFMRDRFTCQSCGDGRGGNLQAHHIKPFAKFPDLRFDVANGVTLCWDCHDKQHACKVGRRRKKARGQFALPL